MIGPKHAGADFQINRAHLPRVLRAKSENSRGEGAAIAVAWWRVLTGISCSGLGHGSQGAAPATHAKDPGCLGAAAGAAGTSRTQQRGSRAASAQLGDLSTRAVARRWRKPWAAADASGAAVSPKPFVKCKSAPARRRRHMAPLGGRIARGAQIMYRAAAPQGGRGEQRRSGAGEWGGRDSTDHLLTSRPGARHGGEACHPPCLWR